MSAGEVRHPATGGSARSLQTAVWLPVVGYFAPGGWTWGMAGPTDHSENDMISLWFVGLVLTPALVAQEPAPRSSAVQLYLLAVLAVCASTFRGEELKWTADGPPPAVAAACLAAVMVTHPDYLALFRV